MTVKNDPAAARAAAAEAARRAAIEAAKKAAAEAARKAAAEAAKKAVAAAAKQATPKAKTDLSARAGQRPVASAVRQAFGKDELSLGLGLALRARSAAQLGGFAPVRLQAADTVAASAAPAAATAATASQEVQDQARRIIENTPMPNPNYLANVLREASPELRQELIKQIADSDNAAQWLQGVQAGIESRKGGLNEGYDDMEVVASAMSEAFRSGAIDSADLHNLAEQWGPETTAIMVQSLALASNSSGVGGVVEALGEQAQALGFDQAAALAFTSNQTLIDKHYPTAADQRAAFEHVEAFLEDLDDSFSEYNPEYRNAVSSALVNAARLTANGNGYTPEALDEELRELGPTLVGEAIGQAGERIFNGEGDGPLDALGDAATRVAAGEDGDDKTAWETNAAIAYTQSASLIESNLSTPEARLKAFDTINAYLADTRGEWSLAANDGGYSLVRAPQALDGMNRLLAAHPEMITELLERGPSGEADLVQLFESISLNPDVPQAERDRLQRTLNDYVSTQMASIEPGNANEVGAHVGTLLATLQIAADRAVEGAEAPDDRVKELALGVASGLVGAAAKAALGAVTGPLGSAIGGAIISKVLGEVFKNDPPGRTEIERAFAERLLAAGINVSAGERSHDELTEVYRELHDAITAQIAATDDPALEQKLNDQLNVVQGVLNGLAAYGDTHDSSERAGEINTELNRRNDDP